MSEAAAEEVEESEDVEEEVEEQAEQQADDDQPAMDGEDFADLDAIAEEVESETAPETDALDTADGEENEEVEEDTSGDSSAASTDAGGSWGDMYVGTLTTVSNALIEEHGKPGAEEIDEDLARQLHLDEYFSEWMEQRGKADMDPAQGVMFGTTMFLVAVVGTKTDLPAQMLEEADL